MDITISGKTYHVEVIRKPIRNMYLRVKGPGVLYVTCPRMVTEERIRRFLQDKAEWIARTENKQFLHEMMNREGTDSPLIWWLGERKYVRYETASRDRMEIQGDIITFYLKEITDARIEKTFRKYAAEQILALAERYRPEWDAKICDAHRLPRPVLQVRKMKSRWGYCVPAEHRITLNLRLIHYSEEALEYILLHEYVHFLVPNHSAAFYAEVRRHMPQYKAYEALLK